MLLTFVLLSRFSDEVTPRQREIFEASLKQEVEKYEQQRVVSLEAKGEPDQCSAQLSCLARIAEALGANRLLEAKVSRSGDLDYVSLTLISFPNGEVLGQASGTSDQRSGATSLLGELGQKLFSGVPLKPDMVAGTPVAVSKRWHPRPLPKALFISGSAVAAATLIASLSFGIVTFAGQADYSAYAAQGRVSTIDGAVLNQKGARLEALALTTNILFASGLALTALSALAAVFTDWGSDKVLLEVGVGSVGVVARF